MRVNARQSHDPPACREGVPTRERGDRPIEERCKRRSGPEKILEQRPSEAQARFVAPLAVGAQPLDPVKGRIPGAPGQLRARRVRMCNDAKSTEPSHVLDNGVWLAAEMVRRRLHIDRYVMSSVCADFARIQAQQAVEVRRWVGLPRTIAVVGEDDERE